jgi:hypothetical protein
MLAEIFVLHLEAQMRASKEPISSTTSDIRFVPIKLSVPEKPDEIAENQRSGGLQRAGIA